MCNRVNSKFDQCAECYRKESSANKLTWQMSREDITIRNEDDLRVLDERKRRTAFRYGPA